MFGLASYDDIEFGGFIGAQHDFGPGGHSQYLSLGRGAGTLIEFNGSRTRVADNADQYQHVLTFQDLASFNLHLVLQAPDVLSVTGIAQGKPRWRFLQTEIAEGFFLNG